MNALRNGILLILAIALPLIGCGSRDEVPTATTIAADPAGMWIGKGATSGTDVNIEPDGTLVWTSGTGKVNGTWKSAATGKIEIDLAGAKANYAFTKDGSNFTLNGDDGSVLTFGQM